MLLRWLSRNRSGGHIRLWEEHLKAWLREVYTEETYNVPPNPIQWIKLVKITQFMWHTGSIPTELGWTVMALITKVNTDTRPGYWDTGGIF